MTETIDIDSDNLCTTEDAFEQFQAVSMYEEDEYITLSDIVPTPPANRDISNILHVMPTDNVNLLVEEPLNQVTSTTDQNVQETIPKKRRRKKNHCDLGSTNCHVSGQIESNECIADSDISKGNVTSQGLELSLDNNAASSQTLPPETPDNISLYKPLKTYKRGQYNRKPILEKPIIKKIVKKRGRKPKNIHAPAASTISDKNDSTISEDLTDSASNISNTNTAFLEKTHLNITKRGRRKKIPSKLLESSDKVIVELGANVNLGLPVKEASLPVVKRQKKCNKTKKNNLKDISVIAEEKNINETLEYQQKSVNVEMSNEMTEDEIEDIPLVALSNKIGTFGTSDTELVTENVLLKEIIHPSETRDKITVPKSTKKRGRPKKVEAAPVAPNDSDEIKMSDNENMVIPTNTLVKENIDRESNNSKDIKSECTPKQSQESIHNDSLNKRNSKKPIMSDFEYNIDSIIKNDSQDGNVVQQFSDHCELKIGTSSKRPVRCKVKKNLHYDEGSDEDPYANIELSDDEPRRKKGGRYQSDDEYIPGGKRQLTDLSDSDIDEYVEDEDDLLVESTKQKSRKHKRSESGSVKSPKKRTKNGDKSMANNLDVITQKPMSVDGNDDLEDLLETSIIKTSEDNSKSNAWGTTKEFTDFLHKISQGTDIQIKKAKSMHNSKTPLQIPVIHQNEPKKTVEMCAQTDSIKTHTISVQTGNVHEVPMKNQIALTSNQSEKACEFLTSIVKTTAELGQLMTEKSENFIQKKINTTYVTDTSRMDYCVKKSFLLFRLAKHNLVQMEEDLAKQYEQFLKDNNLIQHREEQKVIESISKPTNSDSDCEIVEEPVIKEKEAKSKTPFNPKTVFLNKELSIKMAKKNSEEPKSKEKLNIKGRHTVWINDSILIKKVKPTQSFLAQDSRNKKPPDTYVSLEMVSDFFKMYNRQKAIATCAQFVRPEWLKIKQNYTCCYFFDKTCESSESPIANNEELTTEVTITENNLGNLNDTKPFNNLCPNSLLTLCTKVIQKMMAVEDRAIDNKCKTYIKENIEPRINNSYISFSICEMQNTEHLRDNNYNRSQLTAIEDLKTLCYNKLIELIYVPDFSERNVKKILSYNSKISNSIYEINENDVCKQKPECSAAIEKVKPLFSICFKILMQDRQEASESANFIAKRKIFVQPISLKCIVFNKVKYMFCQRTCKTSNLIEKVVTESCQDSIATTLKSNDNEIYDNLKPGSLISLKLLCIDVMNDHILYRLKQSYPISLKLLCIDVMNEHIFNRLKQSCPISLNSLCIGVINKAFNKHHKNEEGINVQIHTGSLNFTINNVNTVSEDIFLNDTGEEYNDDNQIGSAYLEEEEEHNYSDDYNANYDNSFADDDNNWVSQVQMKELRSFVEPSNNSDSENSPHLSIPTQVSDSVNIKIEPIDEVCDNIAESIIKTEPLDEEETTFVSLVTVTKEETVDDTASSKEPFNRQNSNSYDGNMFEAFVSTNKMILSMNSYESLNEDVFSQSTSRIRRQYEPDSDGEIENNFSDCLNLLVPQNIETTKDRLMESSSDEDTNKKKKPEKRSRGRPKKNSKTNVPSVKDNATSKREVAVLTRKMREKIRQVEKKKKSSESELEDMGEDLSVIKYKDKVKDKPHKKQSSGKKTLENEIQCNDVDSTEQINENGDQEPIANDKSNKAAISCDKKQDQSNDDDSQLADFDDRSNSPLIHADEPVELLECQPTIPMLEEFVENHTKRKAKLKPGVAPPGPACSKKNYKLPYTDRHGWDCYPIETKDNKIYEHAQILLHKLPESFVETYLKYQDLSEQSNDDLDVDKLTNLHSLHRIQSKEKKRPKNKDCKTTSKEQGITKSLETGVLVQTDIKIEQSDELLPSEDEEVYAEDISPPVPSTENFLAKDLLMNDDGSDSDKTANKSPMKKDDLDEKSPKKPGRTSKVKAEEEKVKNENLMLTADKMMTKELAMLHAPVELKQEMPDIKDVGIKPITRSSTKTSPKTSTTTREQKDKDDSSSEEEKQWFTTKEKLLKRLEKKQECPSVDDAKHAKIVSEFIEKRIDGPQLRLRTRPPRRRSMKKLMERRKQMKILTKELLGDDASHTGKKSYQTYGKGRRNIRKVINKKALSHSTVVANMEEFERKQRLSMRQTQLREILGCEEGVNVVVINDELCLEYDFNELRPVVTVHPFFTKVMKAHQYEGVKFMWDACFESVSQVQSGHAGGGCILAHCMGLGKTLQVLALLHTVLTHPQVGMQRVLVCCPLSTVLNWVDEIHKWIGPVTGQIKVFELSKLKKTYERAYQLEDWHNGGGIFIIGYELFRSLSTLDPVLDCVRITILNKIRTALLDPGPDIVICDEGHLLKNDCSVLAVAMSRVKTKRRIILTGTPMQNNLREYYCMVNFVKPSLLGSYSEYSNRFENPIMNGQHRDSIEEDIKLMKARTHILHKVLEGCLQRQEASVLYPYLPKKHEYTVFVSLTKSQRELYTHYLTNYAKDTKQSVLKDFHVLQKIWTHPQVLHNFFMKSSDDEKEQKMKVEKEDDLVAEDLGASEDKKPATMETWWLPFVAENEVLDALHSSNKFLVIFRLLDECIALGDKVLIFSTSLYTMDALEYFLRRINRWSLGREYYRLDGSVPAEVRQKWCREFNAESNTGTKLFLISTRAGSLGLNMTAANRVVILDTSWNPAHDIQSIFRVYRFGQKKDCYIYRLVAMGTMEQKIYERSVTKQAVACRVVDEQQIDRHYNMSELTELYRLDEDGSGVAAGLAAGVRDAALLRVASSETPSGPLLHAVHEHDSLLRGSGETGLAEDERAAVWNQFQEEQANEHIQNIALKIPKKEFITKNVPKSENTKNDASDQSAPGSSDTKPKSKRGKKSLEANKNTPVQPSTSLQEDPNSDIENARIKKIMDILIQHNFKSTNGPQEIAELIKNVRKTVANPRRGRFKNVDPMTASIAKVLIEEGTPGIPAQMPSGTQIESQYLEPKESAETETIVGTQVDYNSIFCANEKQDTDLLAEHSVRKRRRQRKEADKISNQEQANVVETDSTEMIVGTPVDSIYFENPQDSQEPVDSDNPERKRRRQRRTSDEEYIPDKQKIKILPTDKKPKTRKSNECNLNLDTANTDETITSDIPSVRIKQPDVEAAPVDQPQMVQSANKTIHTKKRNEKKKKTSKKKFVPEFVKDIEKEREKQQVINNEMLIEETVNASESILLSDDDEPVNAPEVVPQDKIILGKQPSNKQDDESPIPLHKSLLTNKNFIKIVAHTYLTGNPMLDEDAAILAAQYSTLKALNEFEATKKHIISGPIYDIAVQVLGRDLLKKLHNSNPNKKDEESVQLCTDLTNATEDNKSANKDNKIVDNSERIRQTDIRNKSGLKSKIIGSKKEKLETFKSNSQNSVTVIDDDTPAPSTSSTVPVTRRRRTRPHRVSAPEVVPVEMFQGPSTLRPRLPSQDECILPDDDDAIIVGDAPTIVHTIASHNKRTSQPIPTSQIPTTIGEITKTRPKVVQIVQKQPVANPIPLPPPPIIMNHKIPELCSVRSLDPSRSDTICLDSDEEESSDRPVEVTTRKALKSTPKLPHATSSTTTTSTDTSIASHVAVPVSKSRLNVILEKKRNNIILVPALQFESAKSSPSKTSVNRMPSKNVSAELIDVMPETITNKQNSSENVSDKLPLTEHMKSKCLLGDIIRISKAGKIEVLRKTDKPPVLVDTSSDKSCVAIGSEDLVLVDDNPKSNKKTLTIPKVTTKTTTIPSKTTSNTKPSLILKNTPKPKLPETMSKVTESAEKSRKSHPSSDNWRSKTPDPLSVIQNVVHIPADKYQTNNSLNSIESHSRENPTPTMVNKSAEKHINISKTSSDLAVKRAEALLKSFEPTKSQKKAANNKVIDLTEALAQSKEAPTLTSTKKIIKNIKMTGTSKEIMINKAGTLISKTKSKPSTSSDPSTTLNSNTKKSVLKTPQKSPAHEVSKRPSPWEDTLPSKKKKPDVNKMSLADFNIDDWDDIIELE